MTQRDPSRDEILARVLGTAAPTPELVPCGTIASATHCCEYHAIHSDDDFAAVRARLAAATALIERFVTDDSAPQGLIDDAVAFLANQPAAPTLPEEPDVDVSDWSVPPKPTRTEAEQAVLDTVAQLPDHWLRHQRAHGSVWDSNLARAELARRGLK